MSDERYDRSADMRLLELQREALGVPPRVVGSTSYTDPDPITDMSKDEDDAYVQSGTILIAALDAHPRSSLIPGALVTISLSVTNDGDVGARGVRMGLALPADTTYRPGTLSIDGTVSSDAAANELFENGAEIGEIEPGARRTLAVKLIIEAGLNDITLSPYLSASSGAVLGLRGMRLTRSEPSRHAVGVERPFYESDVAEHALEPLPTAPPQPAIASFPTPISPPTEPVILTVSEPVTQRAAKPIKKRAIEPKATPKAHDKPKRKNKSAGKSPLETVREPIEHATIEVVRSIDDRLSPAGPGTPILAVRIDQKRLKTLTRLFSGASIGMIAHYLVLNALAARDPLPGHATDGSIAEFVASQEQLLSRALITTRLGKTPAPDSVGAVLPPFPPTLAAHADRGSIKSPPPGEAVLIRVFKPSEVMFVRRILANDNAAPFMRAAQLFVGLCANDAVVADEREQHRVGVALTAYAALATAEISRIFLRAKLSREPDLFKATDSAFDDAARTVLAAVARSIA